MTAAALVARARAVGVVLHLTATGKVGAKGPADAVDALLPELRAHKAALVDLLTGPASWPCASSGQPPQPPQAGAGDALTDADRETLTAWLDAISEHDEVERQRVFRDAATDPQARRCFLWVASQRGIGDAPDPRAMAPAAPTPGDGMALAASAPERRPCCECEHWQADPINPPGGLGACLADAPASHRPSALWPGSRPTCQDWRPAP